LRERDKERGGGGFRKKKLVKRSSRSKPGVNHPIFAEWGAVFSDHLTTRKKTQGGPRSAHWMQGYQPRKE